MIQGPTAHNKSGPSARTDEPPCKDFPPVSTTQGEQPLSIHQSTDPPEKSQSDPPKRPQSPQEFARVARQRHLNLNEWMTGYSRDPEASQPPLPPPDRPTEERS